MVPGNLDFDKVCAQMRRSPQQFPGYVMVTMSEQSYKLHKSVGNRMGDIAIWTT